MLLTPAISASGVTRAFEAEPGQVRLIRAFVAEYARGYPFLDDLLLAVTELAANAIEHSAPAADGTISVTVTVGAGTTLVAVTDGGNPRSTPHVRPPREDAEGGRGLYLVATVAERWGFTRDPGASTTWCEFGAAASLQRP